MIGSCYDLVFADAWEAIVRPARLPYEFLLTGSRLMQWMKPEFEEVCLAMEVTAYVNTDDLVSAVDEPAQLHEVAFRPAQRAAEIVCAV